MVSETNTAGHHGCTHDYGHHQNVSPKCRIVGKYQSLLIMINPIIFTRTHTQALRAVVYL
jgi:hypothetical protein